MLRFLFLLILLLGAAIGFGYDRLGDELFPRDVLGTWRVYDAAGGFRAVEAPVSGKDAPITVLLDLTLPAPAIPEAGGTLATVTVAQAARTLLAEPLRFADGQIIDTNPQTPERAFRIAAGTLPAGSDGPFTVTVDRGDTDLPPNATIDLVLEQGGLPYRGRAQPVGYALLALGFIGSVLAWTGGSRARTEPTAPSARPARRWGRDGADRN